VGTAPPGTSYQILVTRTHEVLARSARLAASLIERMVGLLAHRGLEPGEGLILPSCRSIHTWFMRFPIDAVFVDRSWRVVALQRAMGPWRISPLIWKAWAVIEVSSGTIERLRLQVGDQLALELVSKPRVARG